MLKNSVSGDTLRALIERIERVREDKKSCAQDEKAIFAEAAASGFHLPTIRNVLKRRAAKPADVQEAEALLDMYLSAIGMKKEPDLFTQVGLMSVDPNVRDNVIEALKKFVPHKGEIIVKAGGQPVRLTRDDQGEVSVSDWQEPKPAAVTPGAAAKAPPRPVPDVDDDGARVLGQQAARNNEAIISNPFPFGDARRARFDEGWREIAGGDGMGPSEDD